MHAVARILSTAGRVDLRSDPPLTLRSTPDAVYLVGSAAGPVGGDELHLTVDVESRSALAVRSVAATMHHPSPSPQPSTMTVDVSLRSGSVLSWTPEPAIFVGGCDHRMTTRIHLASTARMVWREELVLGRRDEAPGSVRTHMIIDRGGRPLLRNEVSLGPAWLDAEGPGGTDGARAIGSLVVVGAAQDPAMVHGRSGTTRWASMSLAPEALLVSALADRPSDLSALFDELTPSLAALGAGTYARSDLPFSPVQPV